MLAMAACSNSAEPAFQGWVEANLIFVAPDETGRVETLRLREGDKVTAGQQLFTVDEDLQQADLRQSQATLTNAQVAFDRADKLLKTGSSARRWPSTMRKQHSAKPRRAWTPRRYGSPAARS